MMIDIFCSSKICALFIKTYVFFLAHFPLKYSILNSASQGPRLEFKSMGAWSDFSREQAKFLTPFFSFEGYERKICLKSVGASTHSTHTNGDPDVPLS